MGHVLDTLTKFGMTVNLTKSAVLLDLRGKQKTIENHGAETILAQSNASPYFADFRVYPDLRHSTKNFPRLPGSEDQLSANSDPDYEASFGCKSPPISPTATLVQEGNHISVAQKCELWYTCLFSISLYGTDAVGVNSALIMFQRQMMTQLRQIGGDHSFLTNNSHRAFLRTHGLEHPIGALHRSTTLPIEMAGGETNATATE